ncbi:hypothetical protein D3C74_374380 [compost metagenome]
MWSNPCVSVHHSVGFIPSVNIFHMKSVLFKHSCRDVSSETDLAGYRNLLVRRNFCQAAPQFGQRNVDGPGNISGKTLCLIPDIDNEPARTGKLIHLMPLKILHHPLYDIRSCVAGHIHGILGRRIRRCVGQLDIRQFIRLEVSADSRGNHINPFIGPFTSHCLCSVYISRMGVEQQFNGNRCCTRIIACM